MTAIILVTAWLVTSVAVALLIGRLLGRRGEQLKAAVRRHPAGNPYVREVIEGRARQRQGPESLTREEF